MKYIMCKNISKMNEKINILNIHINFTLTTNVSGQLIFHII